MWETSGSADGVKQQAADVEEQSSVVVRSLNLKILLVIKYDVDKNKKKPNVKSIKDSQKEDLGRIQVLLHMTVN